MNRRKDARGALLALAILGSLWPGHAEAQIFGRGARTEFISGFGIRSFVSFRRASDLLVDGVSSVNPDNRSVRVRVTPISLVYGLHPRISLIAVVPLIDARLTRETGSGDERIGAGPGLGDMTLMAKWRFFKRDRGRGSFQLALQGGIKTPTGRSDLRDRHENRLPQPLQRGTGSWDPTADLIAGYVTPSGRWFLGASVGGVLTTAAHAFEPGNRVGYDAMIKARVTGLGSRDAFLLLEINGRWQGRARAGSESLEDSGGHLLYLSPGIQVLLRPNLVAEGGVQLPLLRHLNGTQLGPDAVALFGLRYIIVP